MPIVVPGPAASDTVAESRTRSVMLSLPPLTLPQKRIAMRNITSRHTHSAVGEGVTSMETAATLDATSSARVPLSSRRRSSKASSGQGSPR